MPKMLTMYLHAVMGLICISVERLLSWPKFMSPDHV